jgi:hypothetical protein
MLVRLIGRSSGSAPGASAASGYTATGLRFQPLARTPTRAALLETAR